MTSEASTYIEGLLWDRPANDHLVALTGAIIAARRARGHVLAVNDIVLSSETRTSLEEIEDDEWDWEEWLHRGVMSPGRPVIAVRDQSSGSIIGFCAIETTAQVAGAENGIVLMLHFEIASVYVRPDRRGLGFGSILRQGASTYLHSIIDNLAEIPPDDLSYFEFSGLQVTVSAHPQSAGGLSFSNQVSADIEHYLAGSTGKWWGSAAFIDDTDPEEAPSLT